MIACFLSNFSAKYYENPTMLSRVIAKNIGDVFLRHSVVVVVVLYSPNTNRYITDTCKTNNSIKHIWHVAREALVLSQLATYS